MATLITVPVGFDAVSLTDTIDMMIKPKTFMGDQNLYPFEGLETSIVALQRTNEGLCLVKTAEQCAPPPTVNRRDRTNRLEMIRIPHTPIRSTLHICDFMGRLKWDLNSDRGLVNFADEVAAEQRSMAEKLEHTLEYRRIRALFGEVLDADGSLLVDLFERFGFVPQAMTLNLADANFDVRNFCVQLTRYISDTCAGTFSGIRVLLTRAQFDALISHPKVADIWKRCCDTQVNLLSNLDESGFTLPGTGVTFLPFKQEGCWYNEAGVKQSVDFFAPPTDPGTGNPYASSVGVAYATNAPGNYKLYGAPLAHVDFANRKADRLLYATIEPLFHGTGFEMWASMNALPITRDPRANVRVVVTV